MIKKKKASMKVHPIYNWNWDISKAYKWECMNSYELTTNSPKHKYKNVWFFLKKVSMKVHLY